MGCLFLFAIAVFFPPPTSDSQIPLQEYRQRLGNYRKNDILPLWIPSSFPCCLCQGVLSLPLGGNCGLWAKPFSESDLYNADVLKISFAPVGKSSVCVHLCDPCMAISRDGVQGSLQEKRLKPCNKKKKFLKDSTACSKDDKWSLRRPHLIFIKSLTWSLHCFEGFC